MMSNDSNMVESKKSICVVAMILMSWPAELRCSMSESRYRKRHQARCLISTEKVHLVSKIKGERERNWHIFALISSA